MSNWKSIEDVERAWERQIDIDTFMFVLIGRSLEEKHIQIQVHTRPGEYVEVVEYLRKYVEGKQACKAILPKFTAEELYTMPVTELHKKLVGTHGASRTETQLKNL